MVFIDRFSFTSSVTTSGNLSKSVVQPYNLKMLPNLSYPDKHTFLKGDADDIFYRRYIRKSIQY